MTDYWSDHPPVHELVAAYLGVKSRPLERAVAGSSDDPSGIGVLMRRFPNGQVPAGYAGVAGGS